MAATIRDVALKAGTSVAAASHTLNGRSGGSIRVSVATRERILKAASELGYFPHPIARSLATGRTQVLGLVLPYPDAFIDQNPFCTHVMHGVFHAAIAHHYNLMMFTAFGEEPAGAGHALDGGQKVDGLILVLPNPSDPMIAESRRREIPAVAVVSPRLPGVSTVNADDEAGGYLGGKHLLDLGHTRIAFLEGHEEVCTSKPRLDGFMRAMCEAGVMPSRKLIISSGFDTRLGYASMQQLLSLPDRERPTAVFAINDLCANGAIMAIREAGLRVPEDIAVVGYDDTEFCDTTRPTLTSVNMSIEDLGFSAVKWLVSLIEEGGDSRADIVLPVSLTVRQSCGGASHAPTLAATKAVVRKPKSRSVRVTDRSRS